MPNTNEDLDKKPDLWSSSNPEKKDDLKESFSDLKNELGKLKNQVKEWQEEKKDVNKLDKLDKEIQNIDTQIKIERELENTKKDWNISAKQEEYLANHMQKITQWLKDNPWEANQWRAEAATSLLKDIYSSDPNPIANSMQKIIRFILG